jgi:hypothetical protein
MNMYVLMIACGLWMSRLSLNGVSLEGLPGGGRQSREERPVPSLSKGEETVAFHSLRGSGACVAGRARCTCRAHFALLYLEQCRQIAASICDLASR